MQNLLLFIDYLKRTFSEEELTQAFEDNSFDLSQLEEEYIESLPEDEARTLLADIVYIAMNELLGSDFDTTYDVLDSLGIDMETIRFILDY